LKWQLYWWEHQDPRLPTPPFNFRYKPSIREPQPPPSPPRPVETPITQRPPVATPGAEQAQGLPCPEGQYRPPGGGWCVPKPVATGYAGIPTVPYGSLFSGGFFGGGQGVSAGSFT
jgi:hypothetical protein